MDRIWTVGGVLLDTHVTWKDVEAAMSRVGLIDPDWEEQDDSIPNKFVIMIFTAINVNLEKIKLGKEEEIELEMAPKEEEYFGYYHREVTVCQLIQDYLTVEDKFAVPKIYCINPPLSSENRGRGFVLMEFIDNDGDPDVANDHIEEIGEDPIGLLRSFSDDEVFLEKLKKLETFIAEVKNEQFQNYLDQATEHKGIKRVFAHGDFHPGNILWKKEEDECELKAVIDYQFSHFGSPAWDLVIILLDMDYLPDDKLRNWRHFTKMFYELHSEQATPHFSYEQFESAFLHIWCLLFVIDRAEDMTEEITEESKLTEELKTDFTRINTLLDMFLEFHPENRRRFEEYKNTKN